MNADGDVMDGVPVPLYIDPAEQKELERSKELAKKNGVSKEAYAKSRAQTVLSIFNLNNLFGRNKVRCSSHCHTMLCRDVRHSTQS
jgi:hypothetical protein